jgi:hypothetical protein
MENNSEDRWVTERLATLDPDWQADAAAARARLDERLEARRPWSWIAAATAAAACAAVLTFPAPRAIAQRLWDRLVLNRVEVVRIDLPKLPLKSEVTMNGGQVPVKDPDEAERVAGFRPNLPAAGVAAAEPALSVTSRITARQTVRVADLEAALKRAGAAHVRVPAEWDGVTIQANIGPMVTADYPDGQVLQSRPVELLVPSGFALEHFIEVAFQSIGVGYRQASEMSRKFAANPALLLNIPSDEAASVREVPLRGGTGLAIDDFDDGGKLERVTIVWSTSERVYSVSSKTFEVSKRLADSIP